MNCQLPSSFLRQLRNDKLGKFSGVANQPRYVQMGGWLRCRFGSAGDANAGVACRQRDELFTTYDLFKSGKNVVVVVQQLVARDAFVFQSADDFAIVFVS